MAQADIIELMVALFGKKNVHVIRFGRTRVPSAKDVLTPSEDFHPPIRTGYPIDGRDQTRETRQDYTFFHLPDSED